MIENYSIELFDDDRQYFNSEKSIIIDIVFSEMLICPILRYGILWIDTVENQGCIGVWILYFPFYYIVINSTLLHYQSEIFYMDFKRL